MRKIVLCFIKSIADKQHMLKIMMNVRHHLSFCVGADINIHQNDVFKVVHFLNRRVTEMNEKH